MALAPRLELRQGQALVMTPQLMQAIKLLQMSNIDLVAYVETELEKNPLLERSEPPESAGPINGGEDGYDLPTGAEDAPPRAGDWLETDLSPSAKAISERLGTDLGNVFPDDAMPERAPPAAASLDPGASPYWTGVGSGGAPGDDDLGFEAYMASERSLADHLAEQLHVAEKDPKRRLIGQFLIDLVDEAGYLTQGIEIVAEKLGTSLEDVLSVLAVVQTFDPAGVAARDLKECLAIQLKERDRYDPAMAALVGHLELLARHDWAGLKRVCGVDDEDLGDMVAELKRLVPKPGLAFGSTIVQPVVPDVTVRPAADGSWHVELNSETLPRVLVNQTYYATVAKTARSDKDKGYLSECLQTANWLVKSLDQRAKTILKVASEIVRQQDGFLAYGVAHLRPLNLRTIADAIGMHESTVSRVTSNKYLGTPRGIFEMKYFFSSAIASSEGGEAHSAEAVRHRIRALIDQEDPSAILSDDSIVDVLKKAGIDIARRTVAKYRESMKIPSSVERRRLKQLGGR
jgi:RNA polymerase sigma-54 factor